MKKIATIVMLVINIITNVPSNNDNVKIVIENNHKIVTLNTINVEYQSNDIQALLDDKQIILEDKTNIVYAHDYVVGKWFDLKPNDTLIVDGKNYTIVNTALGYSDGSRILVNEENIVMNQKGDITLVTCADSNGGRYIVWANLNDTVLS